MKLVINGIAKNVSDSITVEELLKIEEVKTPQYVSVQLNETFVLSEDFAVTKLSEGDRVEFLYFMGGGALL